MTKDTEVISECVQLLDLNYEREFLLSELNKHLTHPLEKEHVTYITSNKDLDRRLTNQWQTFLEVVDEYIDTYDLRYELETINGFDWMLVFYQNLYLFKIYKKPQDVDASNYMEEFMLNLIKTSKCGF